MSVSRLIAGPAVPFHFLLKWLCSVVCMATFLGLCPVAFAVLPAKSPVHVVINIPAAKLTVYEGDNPVQSYPVGLGQPRYPTPEGAFYVIRKTRDPGWENPYLKPGQVQIMPGDKNPLGTRWIGFKPGPAGEYGIHGTDTPQSVGQFRSHGCVRMKNQDVVDLFERVSLGTPVYVVYQPFEVSVVQNRLQLKAYPNVYRHKTVSLAQVLAKIQHYQPDRDVKNLQSQLLRSIPAQPNTLDLGPVTVLPSLANLPNPPIVLSAFVKLIPLNQIP